MKDLRTMARYLRPCRWDFFVAILLLLVECGFEMAIPLLMTGIIDDGVALGDVPRIWKLGAAMALCAGLALIAGFIYARFAARAAYRFGGGLREAEYELGGSKIRCAVVSGLGNARKLIQDLKAGRAKYDFVEVMACPGGCVGGGGQPVSVEDEELYGVRGERLYDIDRACKLRFSHENPEVQQLYREFLGEPLSHRSEELLHTDHRAWDMPK